MSSPDLKYKQDGEEAKAIAKYLPYFPFKGIPRFYDIGGFLAEPEVFQKIVDIFVERYEAIGIDSVCLFFMSKNNVLVSGNQLIWWPKGNPPQDRTIIKADVKTVSMSLYIPMVIVSIIGIIMAIILIDDNNHFLVRGRSLTILTRIC